MSRAGKKREQARAIIAGAESPVAAQEPFEPLRPESSRGDVEELAAIAVLAGGGSR